MICAWKELLEIIPGRLTRDVNSLGKDSLLELRLRRGSPAELVMKDKICRIGQRVTQQELDHCVNSASRYSPWASSTVAKGFITAPGGHRIGLCGEAVTREGMVTGIRNITSLCIRVARDFPGIGCKAGPLHNSAVIIGAPGWGKTTLLRDVARAVAEDHSVSVVDERGELFPDLFVRGHRMDVLTGAPKASGIEMMLRCLGPEFIAVDEITAEEDTAALLNAHGSGVKLLATAHAGSMDEFRSRLAYRKLIEHNVFRTALILRPDKTYTSERIRA